MGSPVSALIAMGSMGVGERSRRASQLQSMCVLVLVGLHAVIEKMQSVIRTKIANFFIFTPPKNV